ncbi:MAG TPA: CPBP family intramembrane glutamic endopeptidase, partial [Bryobacteraceae bacterium]|nr:CPBP family intramembrane glutamic endopeptidase [Bryobacteraceae bacterium]
IVLTIGAIASWYVALPVCAATDLGFGVLLGWALLSGFLARIYPTPYPHVEISILAKLAVFQSAALALMAARGMTQTGYGFVPTWREIRIGALHFVYFAPIGLPLALGLRAVHFAKPAPLWVVAGTFVAFLWVVALAEEFLFRGVLQALLEERLGNQQAALLATSVLFGLVHLWFRGFPNWRWALVAGTLGWFCGRARNQAGGIRASVVTHALTVAAWRAFFA